MNSRKSQGRLAVIKTVTGDAKNRGIRNCYTAGPGCKALLHG